MKEFLWARWGHISSLKTIRWDADFGFCVEKTPLMVSYSVSPGLRGNAVIFKVGCHIQRCYPQTPLEVKKVFLKILCLFLCYHDKGAFGIKSSNIYKSGMMKLISQMSI